MFMGHYGMMGISFAVFAIIYGGILALVAKLKKRSWLGWGLAGAVVGSIPFIGWIIWIVLLLVLSLGARGEATVGMPSGPSGVPDFTADYQSSNIAIDSNRNKIWVRDVSGQSRVFDRSEILRWNTSSVEVNRNGKHWIGNCAIEVHVRDLSRPKWRARFSRHGTFLISSERSNEAEMQEWYSRLTTWINNA